MKNFWIGAIVGIVLFMGSLFAGDFVGLWSVSMLSEEATEKAEIKDPKKPEATLMTVCELTIKLPLKGLDNPPEVRTQTVVAEFDFEAGIGWYQGLFAISETRKGQLRVDGKMLTVSRPAMFPRFETMVTGEEFTVNRETGELQQTLSFQGDRKMNLISGFCGKLLRAPF